MWNFIKRVGILVLTNAFIMLGAYLIIYLLERYLGINITWDTSLMSLLLYGFIFGMWWSIISLYMSKGIAKRTYNINILDISKSESYDNKLQSIITTIKFISDKKWVKVPEIWYYNSSDPNAFATWPSKDNSLIAVSTWLLENMNESEINAVIWHEMAHIYNGDMVTMTLIQWLMNTFVFFLSRVVGIIWSSRTEEATRSYNPLMTFLLEIIFGITGTLIISRFSQFREYRADKWSANILGKQGMIYALEKLQLLTQWRSKSGNDQFATMKINGWGNRLSRLFATHPTLSARIYRLQNMKINM